MKVNFDFEDLEISSRHKRELGDLVEYFNEGTFVIEHFENEVEKILGKEGLCRISYINLSELVLG